MASPPMRVVRPLPTPRQKVEPLLLDPNNALPLKTVSDMRSLMEGKPLPLIPPSVIPALTSPLKILDKDNNSEEETKHDNGLLRVPQKNDSSKSRTDDDDGVGEGGNNDKEGHCDSDISLLQKRIVILAPQRPSLDSDTTLSDKGEFIAPSVPNIVLPPNVPIEPAKSTGPTRNVHSSPMNYDVHTGFNLGLEDGEEESYADYAWVLSNRILHYQNTPQHMGKWVSEKKGKRYTEPDYESVLKVLRTL